MMVEMQRSGWLEKVADMVAKLSLIMASLCLLAMLLLMNVEVLGRYVFNFSTFVADEYSAYLFVGCIFSGFAYSLHHGSFLRVNLIVQWLSPRHSQYLQLGASIIGLSLSLILAYETALLTFNSYDFQSKTIQSSTPLFLPQLTMPLGMLATSVIFLNETVKSVRALIADAGAADRGSP